MPHQSIIDTAFQVVKGNLYAFFLANALAACAGRERRHLPKLPIVLLPRFERLSPLPIVDCLFVLYFF